MSTFSVWALMEGAVNSPQNWSSFISSATWEKVLPQNCNNTKFLQINLEISKCVFPRKSARHAFYLATTKIHQTTKLYIPGPHKKHGRELQPANQRSQLQLHLQLNMGNNTKINYCYRDRAGTPPPQKIMGTNFKSTFSISGFRLHRIIQPTTTLNSHENNQKVQVKGIFICTFCVILCEDKWQKTWEF